MVFLSGLQRLVQTFSACFFLWTICNHYTMHNAPAYSEFSVRCMDPSEILLDRTK